MLFMQYMNDQYSKLLMIMNNLSYVRTHQDQLGVVLYQEFDDGIMRQGKKLIVLQCSKFEEYSEKCYFMCIACCSLRNRGLIGIILLMCASE